jgi:hypothetical protein
LAAALAAAALATGPVRAQANVDVAVCLLENSTEEHETAMKEFLVAVLSESNRAEIESSLIRFGAMIADISVRQCGVTVAEMESPAFLAATERYGELLGLRVMERAMANLGLQ